jgi:hypothetical protein
MLNNCNIMTDNILFLFKQFCYYYLVQDLNNQIQSTLISINQQLLAAFDPEFDNWIKILKW